MNIYTIFESLSQHPKTSAQHNCQIYHKSTLEFDARDVKIISPLIPHHISPRRFVDFSNHIGPYTIQPYTEDCLISPHVDYIQDNILDEICSQVDSFRS